LCHDLGVSLHRELATIRARQVNRTAGAANVVLIGGALGTLALLFGMDSWAGLAAVSFAAAVTAALYAGTSALSARAQVAVARHLDAFYRRHGLHRCRRRSGRRD
jgi:VIT1/CCC1 family predicted Fe2+/Mn2+ transporter